MSFSFAHKKSYDDHKSKKHSHFDESKIYYSKTEQCYVDRKGRYYYDHNTSKVYLSVDESSDKKYYVDEHQKKYFYDHKGNKHYSKKDEKCYDEESTCEDWKKSCKEDESKVEESDCEDEKDSHHQDKHCPLYGGQDVDLLDPADYANDNVHPYLRRDQRFRDQSRDWFKRSAYFEPSNLYYPNSVQSSVAKLQFYNQRFNASAYPGFRVFGYRGFGYPNQAQGYGYQAQVY